jgi:adenylate cyclase
MDDSRAARRLAAIVVADIAGYSRLLEADESGTLAALRERQKSILEPVIRDHGGRIVKVMGDGALLEFASAVNAVNASLDLQRQYGEANQSLPEARRIVLRIGINLGEVVGEGDDIFGDGINVAARLEPLAEPGGVFISAKVHEEVRGKVDVAFEDVGERQLKNISNPVRAYRWRSGEMPIEATVPSAGKPSIAILPFANMSGDPEQQYFSDGITEDIITELSRFRHLHVAARNSSFRYRGSDLDLVRVGRELGVHYLVEGSVRKLGPRIRITAQLIDTQSGHHLWAEKYDRDQEDIFAVQDRVVRTIVSALSQRVSAVEAEVAQRKPPASLAAYECVLRADALPLGDAAAQAEARRLYEKAIELDPQYARAYALLAVNYNVAWESDLDAPDNLLNQALEFGRKAVALDDSDSVCHNALGLVYLHRRAYSLAEHHCQRALEINPNRPVLLTCMGYLYSCLGEAEKAIGYFREARILDPTYHANWYWAALGAAHFDAGQYAQAIEALGRASDDWYWTRALLAACHAELGADSEARHHARETLRLSPGFSIAKTMSREPLKREQDRLHLIAALRKAGLPE